MAERLRHGLRAPGVGPGHRDPQRPGILRGVPDRRPDLGRGQRPLRRPRLPAGPAQSSGGRAAQRRTGPDPLRPGPHRQVRRLPEPCLPRRGHPGQWSHWSHKGRALDGRRPRLRLRAPAALTPGAQPGGTQGLGDALQAGRRPGVRRRCRLASDHPRTPGRAGSGSGTLHDHSRAGPAGGASSACDDDRHHRLTCAGARAILLSRRPGRAPRRRGAVGRSGCRPHPGAADRRALRAVHRLPARGPATGSRRPVGATGAGGRT